MVMCYARYNEAQVMDGQHRSLLEGMLHARSSSTLATRGAGAEGVGCCGVYVGISGTDSELTSYYFGLNYYPSKATSFMVGYEIAEAENKAKTDKNEIDGLRARLQVLW